MAACLRDPRSRVDEKPQPEDGLVAQSAWDLKRHSLLVVHVIRYTIDYSPIVGLGHHERGELSGGCWWWVVRNKPNDCDRVVGCPGTGGPTRPRCPNAFLNIVKSH